MPCLTLRPDAIPGGRGGDLAGVPSHAHLHELLHGLGGQRVGAEEGVGVSWRSAEAVARRARGDAPAILGVPDPGNMGHLSCLALGGPTLLPVEVWGDPGNPVSPSGAPSPGTYWSWPARG